MLHRSSLLLRATSSRAVPRASTTTAMTLARAMSGKALTVDTMNQKVVKAEYAVRAAARACS